MQVVQTTAAPPYQGRICLARTGCTRKSRNALRNMVAACSSIARSSAFLLGRRGVPRMLSREVRATALLYSVPMLARIVRVALLVELAAWAALGGWLGAGPLALAALVVAGPAALRLAIIA